MIFDSTTTFDSTLYGPEVELLLALDGRGGRLMPLAIVQCSSEKARSILKTKTARGLFPQSRAPEAALSGLWLYFSCFEESHNISQDIATPEGSFWHGILHRQEPDPGNAAYWFRRVGRHPIFSPLRQWVEEAGIKMNLKDEWDPFTFIDFCEEARRHPGSDQEKTAREIQRAEWQLLFDYCASPASQGLAS